MIRCLHCHAETSNGLALCELCRRAAATYLEYLAVYFRNLARWRPGRAGARPVPGSRVLYDGTIKGDGTGDRISDTLDATANMLTTRARELCDDRPHLKPLLDRLVAARKAETITEAEAIAWLCKGFDRYLTSISTLDWCGDFVTDLGEHERRLRGLTEHYVPGWYAGACRTCGHPTHVVAGLSWVTCGSCGTTTYARDHLEVILEEARWWRAGRKEIAGAVVALVDSEMSVPKLVDRIRKWDSWGWIISTRLLDADGDETGPKRYQMGAVLDLVWGVADAPTRPKMRSA